MVKFEMLHTVVLLHQHLRNNQISQQHSVRVTGIHANSKFTTLNSFLFFHFNSDMLMQHFGILFSYPAGFYCMLWWPWWRPQAEKCVDQIMKFLGILGEFSIAALTFNLSKQLSIILFWSIYYCCRPSCKDVFSSICILQLRHVQSKATIRTPAGHRSCGLSAVIKVE